MYVCMCVRVCARVYVCVLHKNVPHSSYKPSLFEYVLRYRLFEVNQG